MEEQATVSDITKQFSNVASQLEQCEFDISDMSISLKSYQSLIGSAETLREEQT